MQDFRNLRVWRAAHAATLSTYRVTAGFPRAEYFDLIRQLRRAAASVGANVAEGCARTSDTDARRSHRYAFASACEVLNHVLLARDLGLLDAERYEALEAEWAPVRRMLSRLIARLGT